MYNSMTDQYGVTAGVYARLEGKKIPFGSIGYSSLGRAEGELRWFYCDSITVEGVTYYRYPVALTEQSLSDGRGFAGLWNGERREQNA